MEINRTLELNYLQAIQKRSSKWTDEERKVVFQRNSFVHKHFEFNEKVINQLQALNRKLQIEEERIVPFYKKLIYENEKLIREKIIDDFNLEGVISTFSDNHYKNLDTEIEGNPILETRCDFMNHQNGILYFEDDWKDNAIPEYLIHFKHCYSFHHLYDHTDFTW